MCIFNEQSRFKCNHLYSYTLVRYLILQPEPVVLLVSNESPSCSTEMLLLHSSSSSDHSSSLSWTYL